MLVIHCHRGDRIRVADSELLVQRFEPGLDMAMLRLFENHPAQARGELVTVSTNGWLSARCILEGAERWFRVKLSLQHAVRLNSAKLVFDADREIEIHRMGVGQ